MILKDLFIKRRKILGKKHFICVLNFFILANFIS